MNRAVSALLILALPGVCLGATAPDLSSRIQIDGRAVEYTADEWILDGTTAFREFGDDSRWGVDNDIWRVAVTWDTTYLYIAVEGVFQGSALMTFIEHAAGGIPDLVSAGPLRRNIVFAGVAPNTIVQAEKTSLEAAVAVVSTREPLEYLQPDEYNSRFFQPTNGIGALEIALPWSRVFPDAGILQLLAAITGAVGSGAGDAAPDPAGLLSADRQAQAWLDNYAVIPVDADHDSEPDMGVSPRSVVSFALTQKEPVRDDWDVGVRLESSSFAPDLSQELRFRIDVDAQGPVELFVSCDVYSVSGRKVRTLFRNDARVFQAGVEPPWDQWDGRDDRGEIVRGGVYVVLATTGASPGEVSRSAKQSAAVVR